MSNDVDFIRGLISECENNIDTEAALLDRYMEELAVHESFIAVGEQAKTDKENVLELIALCERSMAFWEAKADELFVQFNALVG